MIEKLKKNTKIKIISLLSAIVLWMYVMAVVDPEDTKLYEDIPITITNLNEINDLDLVVDPDEDLVASVYVKGNLSDLQKIKEVLKKTSTQEKLKKHQRKYSKNKLHKRLQL